MQDIKSTYKNQLHFYTRSEKETVSFTIVLKRVKILRSKLNQTAERLVNCKYKTMMKEIKVVTNKWKDIRCHGLEEFILLKCPYYAKQSYRFNTNPIKIPLNFFL